MFVRFKFNRKNWNLQLNKTHTCKQNKSWLKTNFSRLEKKNWDGKSFCSEHFFDHFLVIVIMEEKLYSVFWRGTTSGKKFTQFAKIKSCINWSEVFWFVVWPYIDWIKFSYSRYKTSFDAITKYLKSWLLNDPLGNKKVYRGATFTTTSLI